ncbi:2-acylglycerol O-acyltransferase 2-like [Haemaphysalis longicornis]
MGFLGVKWTPLRLPLRRRLETLAAQAFAICFWCCGIDHFFIFCILLFTRFYPLPLAYAAWVYWDRKTCARGGRWIKRVRSWGAWNYLRDYFPVQLVKTCDLPADQNYLFGYHPHALMAVGATCNFVTDATNFKELFPGIRTHVVSLEFQFYLPFRRDLFLACGVCSSSRESLDYILSSKTPGKAAVIVVGGASEMALARPRRYTLFLTRRKGFIRVAMKHGTPLVPVFTFGEIDILDQAEVSSDSWLGRILALIRRLFGYTLPLFWGRGFFQYNWGLVPHRKRIVTVVGKPLEVPKVECPRKEEVDLVHRQYTEALIQLYNDHKDKYAASGSELVIL